MKTLKYFALGLLAVAGLTLQSCGNDDHYDVNGDPRTFVYIDFNTPRLVEFNVTHTPVGHFGEIAASFPVKIQYAVEGPTEVKFTVDNTLIDAFNAENGTDYLECPAEVLAGLELTSTVIPAGSYEGNEPLTVTLPEEYFSLLTEAGYVIPLRATSFVKKDVRGSEEHGIVYLVINTSGDEGFFSTLTSTAEIVRTPVSVIGTIDNNFSVGLQNVLTSDVEVTGVYDNSLITTYNVNNGTGYQELPAAVRNALEITPATIAAGDATGTINISLTDPSLASQLTEDGYVYPMRLQLTYSNGDVVVQEEEIAYLIVTTSYKVVNEGAGPGSLLGSQISTDEVLTWTVDHDQMSSITNPSDWNTWDSGTYIIDMKTTHNISGLSFIPPYSNYAWSVTANVSLSTDGATWIECGETSSMAKSNRWFYYVLYGAIPAQYIKLTFKTDLWGWYDFGFDGITFYAAD